MRTKNLLKLFAVLGLWPLSASASYPLIAPMIQVGLDVSRQAIVVQGQVRNTGDDPAQDVFLDFPEQNARVVVAHSLAPGESAAVRSQIALKAEDVKVLGHSPILYRAVFHDTTGYMSSSIFWVNPKINPAIGHPIQFQMGSEPGVPQVFFLKDQKGDFQLRNASSTPLENLKFQFFLPLEIQGGIEAHEASLAPQGEMKVNWNLKNFSSQIGASYAGLLVIRGVSNGVPFAETHVFTIRLSDAPPNFGFISRATFFALLWVAGSLAFFYYRKRESMAQTSRRRGAHLEA